MPERGDAGARSGIVLFWNQFGPYHYDRCRSLAEACGESAPVTGIEVAQRSASYEWVPEEGEHGFRKVTLFPECAYEETGAFARFRRLAGCCVQLGSRHVFLCHYERPEYFFVAVLLRLLGRRVYVMQDAKFEHRQRSMLRELLKSIFYLPYCGALVSGRRTSEYLRFLGIPLTRQATGYDTISIRRVRSLAHAAGRAGGIPYSERHFTIVARFVEKKNLPLALEAYRLYRTATGERARSLVICGSGPLDEELRRLAGGIEGVRFTGFLQAEGVAQVLGSTLALILPSTEEQWGLVINEALAVGVPVLVSDAVGARDTLVRSGVNGHLFEPDNAEGLAWFMTHIGRAENEWRRLSDGATRLAPLGDVARFVEGVSALTGEPR
jgi:glycosyltransferase involved in cell wall biosynthesis